MTLPARYQFSPMVNVDRLKPYFPGTGRPPCPARSPTGARRGSTWWTASSSTARLSETGPTTWCGCSTTPRWPTRGSRPSTSQTARGVRGCRTPLPQVPPRSESGGRPAGSAIPPAAAPPPLTPARLGGGGRGSGASAPPSYRTGEGWKPDSELGRIRRRCPCQSAPFTHVVGYRTAPAAFAGEVDTLLDPATYGSRPGLANPGRPGPPVGE